MSLPKQVEEAATAAEEYIASLNETDEETTDTEEASDTEEDTQEDEVIEEQEEEDFKAKYSTLKGKYDAEVPRLHDELRDLKENVFKKLDNLSEKEDGPSKDDTHEELENNPLLEAFREEYGDDLMKYLDAYFESKLPEVVKPVEAKLASMEETQVDVAQAEFATHLDKEVNGEWREAWDGKDPKFTEFLAKPDPSGLYTNSDLADLYSKNWDADKMVKLMNMYFDDGKAPEKKETNKEKDALVAPSKKSPVTAPKTNDDKINWTPESIRQFEIDDRRGQYSSEESKMMWDDLLSAPSENRIH